MANVNTRIKIVSDSTCDLSDELLSMYDITILPMHVLKGGISYLDGIIRQKRLLKRKERFALKRRSRMMSLKSL